MPKFKDLSGKRFGRLLVLRRGENGPHKRTRYICYCECGNIKLTDRISLLNGHTRSCGCLRKEVAGNHVRKPKGYANETYIYLAAKHSAKRRKIEWELTREQVHTIGGSNCHYCNVEPLHNTVRPKSNGAYLHNGIDRVDSSKGYIVGNVVPCCRHCNQAKGTRTVSEYYEWLEKTYNHLLTHQVNQAGLLPLKCS